eukprot:scaffold320763_cov76-Cyclotella_meneghiniana.AAC.1
MGLSSINSLAFAAARNNCMQPSFCHPNALTHRSTALHASIVPKKPNRVIGSLAGETIEGTTHNLILNGDHKNILSPELINGAHNHVKDTDMETTSKELLIDTPKPISNAQKKYQPLKPQNHGDKLAIAAITAFLFLAVGAISTYSPAGCWRYYLAGGICASTSHAITTPIDVVKTRQQVDPTLQEKTMWQATLEIIKTGGPFALLAGLGPTFIGYLIEGGVKFGIYEASKPITQGFLASLAVYFSNPALDSRILCLTLCGFFSGAAASLMLSPMEALRIRMVSDEEFFDKNLIEAGATMMRKEGIWSLSKGLPAMFWKQVPYTITKNASFDLFTTWLYGAWRAMGHSVTANIQIAIPLASALAAAVLSCVSSHPGDMLLSLVNAHEGSKRTRDFAKDIMDGNDGIR